MRLAHGFPCEIAWPRLTAMGGHGLASAVIACDRMGWLGRCSSLDAAPLPYRLRRRPLSTATSAASRRPSPFSCGTPPSPTSPLWPSVERSNEPAPRAAERLRPTMRPPSMRHDRLRCAATAFHPPSAHAQRSRARSRLPPGAPRDGVATQAPPRPRFCSRSSRSRHPASTLASSARRPSSARLPSIYSSSPPSAVRA